MCKNANVQMCKSVNIPSVFFDRNPVPIFSFFCRLAHLLICSFILVVAFLTLRSTYAFYRYAIHFFILDIVMEFFVDAVEFIAFAGFFI